MSQDRSTVYRFAPSFRLDLASGALYRGDKNLSLRPKTFETLTHLVENRGRLVTKAELLEEVWPDACVTDDVLVQSIADIRRALGDDARNPEFVETVPRRGYRFIKDVEREVPQEASFRQVGSTADQRHRRLEPGSAEPAGLGRSARHRLPWRAMAAAAVLIPFLAWLLWEGGQRPSPSDALPPSAQLAIAILPFEVQSDGEGFEWLGRGIPDLIRTALWQAPGLQIIGHRPLAEAASPAASMTPRAAQALARQVGAQRLIQGHFYKLGGSIQINASLIRVEGGAPETELSVRERLESAEEIFAAVDAICLRILQHLAVEKGLHSAQGSDITDLTTESLGAYRHYVAGLDAFLKGGQRGAERAQIEFEQAVKVDPSFAMARMKLAQVQQWARSWGYSRTDPTEALIQAAAQSHGLPEKEQLLIQGLGALWVENDSRKALEIFERLDGHYPVFAAEAGIPSLKVWILADHGQMKQAIDYGQTFADNLYMTADDRARLSFDLARAYRSLGRYQEAIRHGESCLALWPVQQSRIFVHYLIHLGRTYLEAGRRQDALEIFRRARKKGIGDASNLTDAAWGFYMAGEKNSALQLAKVALKEDPEYGNAYHLKGWIELSQGDFSQAASDLERAFAETPPQFGWTFHGFLQSDLPALYYAGVARQKAGASEKGRANLQRLIERCRELRQSWQGQDRPALDFVQTYTYEGLAQCRLGKREECLRLSQEISRQEASRHHELCQNLARLFALQGETELALQWLGKSIQAGARDFQHIYDNPDYARLRSSPRFQEWMKGYGISQAPGQPPSVRGGS